MRRHFPFDVCVLITLFAICHFVGRREAVFGIASIKNSYAYPLAFVGFVAFLAILSLGSERSASWLKRFTAALIIPYVASVFACLFMVFLFVVEESGNPASWPLVEVLLVMLFAPYIGSAAWAISAYVIVWIFFDLYRSRKLLLTSESGPYKV